MDFKICKKNEVRHDIANYIMATEEQKELFWITLYHKHYNNTTLLERINMEHLSRLVKAYIEADEDAKNILWEKYDKSTQQYCDYVKCENIKQEKINMKLYFKMLIPNQNDDFYNTIVDKHYLNVNN